MLAYPISFMPTPLNSTVLKKGALITLLAPNYQQIETTIPFQYNPESLSRTITANVAYVESNRGGRRGKAASRGAPSNEILLLKGAPREEISLSIVIDGIAQLHEGDATVLKEGIYPQLSALELLLYPKSDVIKASNQRTQQGVLEINPIAAPVTLLVWGEKRVLPVRLTSFTINEAYHDDRLNPIRAEVTMGLQILNYSDVPWQEQRAKLFFAHQVSKERLAQRAYITNVQDITGVNVAGRLR